jgi:hypothetical protein
MRTQTPQHHPRQTEALRDDDTPGAPPYPWQPEPSGQARRSECQKRAHLVEVSR